MPWMLGALALTLGASHLELAARNAHDDCAILFTPELLLALRVSPERTEPIRRGGGVLHEGERKIGPVSLPDARHGTPFTPRGIPDDDLPLAHAHRAEEDRSLERRTSH